MATDIGSAMDITRAVANYAESLLRFEQGFFASAAHGLGPPEVQKKVREAHWRIQREMGEVLAQMVKRHNEEIDRIQPKETP